MGDRLTTAVLAVFWAAMGVLLWRDEAGLGRQSSEEVPLDTVFTRVLSAADSSQLRLRHNDEPVGVLRWMPSVLEASPAAAADVPEGMIGKLGGYHLDADLNLSGEAPDRRWRALVQVDFTTNAVWREFHIRLIQRPVAFEITGRAGDDHLTVRFEDGRRTSLEQRVPVKDLLQLPALFGTYLQLVPGHPDLTVLGTGASNGPATASGNGWTARNDVLRVGRHRVRAYRVSTRVFGRHEVAAYFSRAGELLRVNLPDRYTLVGEPFTTR